MALRSVHPRRWLAALLVLGAVAYAAWLAEFWLPTGLPRLRSYVSELGASGQPFARVFRSTDLVAGGLLALWALGELWLDRGARRSQRWAHVLLLAFALATIADALSPMGCAPSVQAGCEARVEGAGAASHARHTITSAVANGSFLALVWFAVWSLVRRPSDDRPHRFAPVWTKRLAVGLALAFTGTTTWLMVEMVRVERYGQTSHQHLLGLAQRLQLATMTLWLLGQVVRVWRATRRPEISARR